MSVASTDELLEALYQGRDRERERLLREHKAWALPRSGERLRSLVHRDAGQLLGTLVRRESMTRTLEVGLANGGSALFICQALAEAGKGLHTAIDPFQETGFDGRGLANIEKAGLDEHLRWIDAPSHEALPRLVADEGEGNYDLAFIDGNHTFDFALTDFFYADLLTRDGGYVVFDDLWMPSILRVVSFVLRNRDYALVPAGRDLVRAQGENATLKRRAGRFVRRAIAAPTVSPLLLAYPLNVCVLQKRSSKSQRRNEFNRF